MRIAVFVMAAALLLAAIATLAGCAKPAPEPAPAPTPSAVKPPAPADAKPAATESTESAESTESGAESAESAAKKDDDKKKDEEAKGDEKVVTTDSGLQYVDIKVGSGKSPQPTSRVTVHYHGTLKSNGKVFDSSVERGQPAEFPLNGVIQGWQEGLLTMKEGGKRKLIIPAKLAYGPNSPSPDIPPNSDLVFEVELIDVQ